MKFWNKLLNAERHIRKRVENAFGIGSAETPLEVRRAILEEVEARIVVDRGKKFFPFGKVIIRLLPQTEAGRDVFEAAFLKEASLKADIYRKFRDARIQHPGNVEILVDICRDPILDPTESTNRPAFEMDFLRLDESPKREIPETKLTVLRGTAEQPTYQMKKERILIGRLTEVLDREGRLVRKNDIAFLDNGDDINTSVGRIHARIWFDFEKEQFRIMDESSRYGTRIIRNGRSIEVPSGNPRGIRLETGDETCLGQACLRFESVPTGALVSNPQAGREK